MIRQWKLLTLLVLTLAAVLALGATASFAATPTAWDAIDVTLILDENPPALVVGATLPASVKLPADVELVLPAGTQPQWVGEILGGDPAQDPSVETTVISGGGLDRYPFTLKRSRSAQIEAQVPNAVTADGTNYRTSVKWPSPTDASKVTLTVKLPKSAGIVKAADGARLLTNDPTSNYYTRTFSNVKAGTPLELGFTFSIASAAPPSAAGTNVPTLTILLVGFGVAVLVLVYVMLRNSGRARELPEGHDEDDEGTGLEDTDEGVEQDPSSE